MKRALAARGKGVVTIRAVEALPAVKVTYPLHGSNCGCIGCWAGRA